MGKFSITQLKTKLYQQFKFVFTPLLFFPVVCAAQYLSDNEITNLISGRYMTFYGSYGGVKFTGAGKWDKNGTITGYTTYWGIRKNWSGTWYVKNNQYCRNLSGSGRTNFQCHRVQKVNANTIRFIKPDGSVSSTSILK